MRRILLTAALVCTLPATAAPAVPEWVRVETPNFVVFGEAGETPTREYAAEFERFREAIGRVVPGAGARPAVPALVFLFKDDKSFAPYRPLYQGKPVDVSGYFAGGASLDVIMLPVSQKQAAMRTIFHEYSHLVTMSITREMPLWLAEGLAEYYSTFEVEANGRRAVLGRVIPSHLVRLNREGLLPLEQLLSTGPDSPLYNEGARRSTFYAQSWALVHMLLNGRTDRRTQFDRYMRLTHSGQPAADAWREVFGGQGIADELRVYVWRQEMRHTTFRFDHQIPRATFTVSQPSEGDVHAALGELRLQVEPATARAHAASAPAPHTPYVQVLRGLLTLEDGRHAEALELFTRAARETDDWLVQYRAAVGLERVAAVAIGDDARTAARAGEAALARALAVKPDLPHAVALQGLLAGPGDEGVALLNRARALAPGRDHYTIWLAQFYTSRGEFTGARALLAPLLSPLTPLEIRDYAGQEMRRAQASEEARRGADQDPQHAVLQRHSPAIGGAPVYREVGPGEQRLEATLERVECPRGRVILHARSGGRALRFTSEDFHAVPLLSYRAGPPPPVRCGPRPADDLVYLTWKLAPSPDALNGVVVAVEFLQR
ncbi:hypothetical protein BH24ACI5_BH24ACI5_12320 [soil metagenome]